MAAVPLFILHSWIVTVTEKWVMLLYVQAGGGVGVGDKGIPYLLGHSMAQVELIHPVESSSLGHASAIDLPSG